MVDVEARVEAEAVVVEEGEADTGIIIMKDKSMVRQSGRNQSMVVATCHQMDTTAQCHHTHRYHLDVAVTDHTWEDRQNDIMSFQQLLSVIQEITMDTVLKVMQILPADNSYGLVA